MDRDDFTMEKLLHCALAFERLLNVQYRVIIGRKGKSAELCIGFSEMDFHHLMGLEKLKDLRIARKNREQVFRDILKERTGYQTIGSSRYIGSIENRFEPLSHIEQLLDDNRLIFRYNNKQNVFSLIEADYLQSTPHKETDVYIFIARNERTGLYYCRSFFPREEKDYTLAPWARVFIRCCIKKKSTLPPERLRSSMTGLPQKQVHSPAINPSTQVIGQGTFPAGGGGLETGKRRASVLTLALRLLVARPPNPC